MNTEPFGTTVFCDDIRQEVSHKITLVGCYVGQLNFNGPAPGVLPTFSALVSLRIPHSVHFDNVCIRVLMEDGADVTEIFKTDAKVTAEQRREAKEKLGKEDLESRLVVMSIPMTWVGLTFQGHGYIKVRANLDDGEDILLGALEISFPEETDEETSKP